MAALRATLLGAALRSRAERSPELRERDAGRLADPTWFQHPGQIGYVCYADRFAGTLTGVADHLDYLVELGVTYLHLMPLLAPRPGPNDGGYAVADYGAVDPRLGTIDDLANLAGALHRSGMSLCIDVVVNHTAREHPWAQRALAGDPAARAFYHVFDDRALPDRYEQTLREVFPAFAPGNFTFVPEMGAWVWTTFNDYQWDLNYGNPAVLVAMAEAILNLCNIGVDVLRLDAVPFLWKRLDTDCENQPEAHWIVELLRSLVAMAAPAVAFKAEAIVPPEQLVQYLGGHEVPRHECDIAYHNQLMVMLWSSLASRDGRLITHALSRMRHRPPATTWMTYVRCHDDIGWAVSDEDAAAVGWDGWSHRNFLTEFYAGEFPGSFAHGARFQDNPAIGDSRISGTAASLCGLDPAGDPAGVETAIRRLVLLYAVAFCYDGIPLVYMGDELGLRNDLHYLDDPDRAADNRWMHRPAMPWEVAERRHRPGTIEARLFGWMQRLGTVQRRLAALDAAAPPEPLAVDDPHLFAFTRSRPGEERFLAVANFSEEAASCSTAALPFDPGEATLLLGGDESPAVGGGRLTLPGLGFAWYGFTPGSAAGTGP